MATKQTDKYGIVYARGMKVQYGSHVYGNVLFQHGIEIQTYYFIRSIYKAPISMGSNGLMLELFKDKQFKQFIGTFHSSFFTKPIYDTPAAAVLFEDK